MKAEWQISLVSVMLNVVSTLRHAFVVILNGFLLDKFKMGWVER